MAVDLRLFYRVLEDKPLTPDDDYYVDFVARAGASKDPIGQMANKIDYSESESITLLTGHRGSGKSTELLRLKAMLEEQGCVVFLGDMRDYVNLTTPIEITDFLISIMLAFSEQIKARYEKDPANESYLARISKWLGSEVKLKEISIGADDNSLKFSIKEDSSFKQLLQTHLRGHLSKLIGQARRFAQDAVQMVRDCENDQDKKVVYIIDSLEQLRGVGAEGSKTVYESVENLFSGHAASLTFPSLHVVYTIPPYLQSLAPGIGRVLGGDALRTLPSVHVLKRSVNEGAVEGRAKFTDTAGVDILKEIVGQRYPDWRALFSDNQLCELAIASGGDIRDFFRLIRLCIVKKGGDSSPADDEIINQAKNDLKREMLPIAKDDLAWLKLIHNSKTAELDTVAKLPQLARFFDTNLVLNYRNGDDWYDVHPLILEELGEAPADCG